MSVIVAHFPHTNATKVIWRDSTKVQEEWIHQWIELRPHIILFYVDPEVLWPPPEKPDKKDLKATKTFVPGGHVFALDDEGNLVDWYVDYHDGYECIVCHHAMCRNCEPDWAEQKCEERVETLPGLEFD